jgi:hypothetical protein
MLLYGNENAIVFPELPASDAVAQPCYFSVEVARVLGQMDGTNTRRPRAIRGMQQIESILEILFVNMNYVGLQLPPLMRYAPGNCPIETSRERSQSVIVSIAIIGTEDAPKSSTLLGELIHSRVFWYPSYDLVSTIRQLLAKVIKKDFASPTRTRATTDQKYSHVSRQP